MDTWLIIGAICGIITLGSTLFFVYLYIKRLGEGKLWILLLAGLFIVPIFILYALFQFFNYLQNVWEAGGFVNHYRLTKYRRLKAKVEKKQREAEKAEYERIKVAFQKGEISRTDLPRVEDGVTCFEFSPEMGLYVDYYNDPRGIVYVESEYNEQLNQFFIEHKDLRLYRMYKFVYLPHLCKELEDEELLHYLLPNAKANEKIEIALASTYPMQYLVYADDSAKIKQGMFFFRGGRDNHGAEYIEGDYHPLHEGSDEEIIAQLDAIVKEVHNKHSNGGLYCKAEKPTIEEGSTDEYADKLFNWIVTDDEVAGLIEEVREKIARLKGHGIAEHLLLKLLREKPKLSRLVVTKDMQIILPDYNDMEIKMEPLVKAVYLLFLRHPEEIVFKHLPDYRQELTKIYSKLRPLGLSDKAIQSIEDVTNPLLNSINEKCARIRGAFVGQFDNYMAKSYYVDGQRGEAKKISLPRNLVIWE